MRNTSGARSKPKTAQTTKKKITHRGGVKKPLTADHVRSLRVILRDHANVRDRALFEVAVSSMLRASDLLSLQVLDVRDATGAIARQRRSA